MKIFNLIFLFLISFFGDAKYQMRSVVLIEYNYNVTDDDVTSYKMILKCINNKSISKRLEGEMPSEADQNDKSTIYATPMDMYQFVDLEKKRIVATERIFDSKYKVIEDLPVMNWKLSKGGESKTIDNFVCNKATLSFRGRNYVAWYTPYIALPFGPWKFYGLPGLILEVSDTENHFHWTATKVIYPSNEKFDLNVMENQKVKQTLTLKQFVQETEEKEKEFMAKVRKNLPRGTVVDFGDFTERGGLELKYEWEVDKKK